MFKKLITYAMLVMAMMAGSIASAVELSSTEVIVPELTGRAVFLSKTANISVQEQESIKKSLENLETTSKVAMVVLLVDSIDPFAIEEYSIKVAEKWKIGKEKEDNGIILVIAAQDRKARLEVGYGLEGVITDAMSNRIIKDYMIPQFKNGMWTIGIMEAIGRVNNLVTDKPLDAPVAHAYSDTFSSGVTKTNSSSSFSTSSLSSSMKDLDGEAAILALIIILIVALFTTGAGKMILLGFVIGGIISFSRKTIGSVAAGVLGGITSGFVGFFFIDSWWIVAILVGAFCGAFGISWLWHVLEILLHIAANAKGGSSSRSGGYSGGGGRFGGGGSSGSW